MPFWTQTHETVIYSTINEPTTFNLHQQNHLYSLKYHTFASFSNPIIMTTKNNPSKNYINTLSLIHGALTMGLILFAAITVFLNRSNSSTNSVTDLDNILVYIVPAMAVFGLMASMFLFKNKVKSAKSKDALQKKLYDYRVATIIKLALIEGPALLSIIAYLITGSNLFLGMAAALILYFILQRPSKNKVVMDLDLNRSDSEQL